MAGLTILLAALNGTVSNVPAHNSAAPQDGTAVSNNAQSLAFDFPTGNSASMLQYQPGDMVNVSWTTRFEYTTVEVWQGPSEDGMFSVETIAANFTQDRTSLSWEAGPLDNSTSNNSFHFQLQKGHVPNTCSDCIVNSPTFQVKGTHSTSQTTTSSITEPISTPSPTPSPTPSSSSSSISSSTKLAIGLGIGLGVSVAIALVVLLWWFLNRQEKRMSEEDDAVDAKKVAAAAKRAKEEKMRYSSGNESSATQASYHSSFQFEEAPQEGFQAFWNRVFGR